MKKLALALVCLVSLAFFASCDPVENPEPNIQALTEQGYLYDGEVIEMYEVYSFGFHASSNPQTLKELASMVITCNGQTICDTTISGTDYTYVGEISFDDYEEGREIVNSAEIIATVTDAAGQTNSARIKVEINKDPEVALTTTDFEWFRHGQTQTGLEEYGLYWESNLKVTHAQIKPLTGWSLFIFDAEDWEMVTTESEKLAFFMTALEGGFSASVYNNVSTTANGTYDDVIGTVSPDGDCYLLHVTSCVIGQYTSAGYPIHIYGQAK